MKRLWHIFTRGSRMRRALEFQTRLFKELAITSNQVLGWRDQIKNILKESSSVLDIAFAYTAYPVKEGRYHLEFFWLKAPDEEEKTVFEEYAKQNFSDTSVISNATIMQIAHSVVSSSALPSLAVKDIDLNVKSFFIETTKENGIIAVAVKSLKRKELTDLMLAESVLTSLANIVSSSTAFTMYSREVERFATRDPLTGLYNQVAFWDLLEYETQRSKRQKYKFSLLVIDIDNFKAINDIFGHDIGDAFLKDFTSMLKSAVRRGDIPARYGGDNFTAILPVCDEEQAYSVAQRIKEQLAQFSLVLPDGRQVKETVSIGIAVYPDHAQDAKDLFLLADNMLFQAKSAGKDRLSFPSEHDSVDVLRSMGEKNIFIMEAIGQKRVVPYFQPIVNVQDMRVEAYEVLTRIVNPDRVIPASEFIETAEDMGMIGKIDYLLIESAFRKVNEHKYTGTLFLNLSPKVLILSEFMPTVRKMMKDYEIDPSRMVFEITERDTVKNVRLTERFIRDMKLDGFRFAIDDFGTGFASFRHIKTFSIDFLKVDGEFIRNLKKQNGVVEKAVVTSISALARSLGIKTIAEFVESEEIMQEVETAGIDFAQGYYIQKPSPDLL